MRLPRGIQKEDLQAWFSAFELWLTKASRIAVVMTRGAYWLSERRRLMTQLGERSYKQMQAGELDASALTDVADQLKRLNEKLEMEEDLIARIRAGEEVPPKEDL